MTSTTHHHCVPEWEHRKCLVHSLSDLPTIPWRRDMGCSFTKVRPRPDLVPVPGHCALALKGMLFRHCGVPSCHHRNFKSQGNMGKKHGTDEILCRQVPVPGYGAWILPSQRVPVPGYRAHVFVRASLKCYIHIGAHAQAPNPGTKSGHGLKL